MSAVRLEYGRKIKEHIGQSVPGNGLRRYPGGQMDPAIATRDVPGNDTVRPISKGYPKDVSFDPEQAAQDAGSR